MSFFKKIGKFVKKALPFAAMAAPFIPGLGPMVGAGLKAASGFLGMSSSQPSTSDHISHVTPAQTGLQEPPGSVAELEPVNITGSRLSPGAWSSIGQLGSAGLSLVGGMQANQANAKQAETQMGFQKDMSNTSYQRATTDMKAAGLNPMLAYSQGGASTPSGASAQISDAVTPALNSARAAEMMNQQIKTLEFQNANVNAQTQNINADTAVKLGLPGVQQAGLGLTRAQTAESDARTVATRDSNRRAETIFPVDYRLRGATADNQRNQARVTGLPAELAEGVLPYLSRGLGSISSAIQFAGEETRQLFSGESRLFKGK